MINKENEQVQYSFVDDRRVYAFIEEILKLPKNNVVFHFETAFEITAYLRAQWAGLFQRFLQEQRRIPEMNAL